MIDNIVERYPELAWLTAGLMARDCALVDGALGLVGEATELLDAIVKEQPNSIIVKEMGDVWWYIAARWLYLMTDYEPSAFLEDVGIRRSWARRPGDPQHFATEIVIEAGKLADAVKKCHSKVNLSLNNEWEDFEALTLFKRLDDEKHLIS